MIVQLTENCNLLLNTLNEKRVLYKLIADHKIGEAKINGVYIYLCTSGLYEPDVVNGKSRVCLRYLNKNHERVEEYAYIDKFLLDMQIDESKLNDRIDGNFSYVDWNSEYLTMTTKRSPKPNSRIRFRLYDSNVIKPESINTFGEEDPVVYDVEYDDNNKFAASLMSSISNIYTRMYIDMNEPLDSYAIVV